MKRIIPLIMMLFSGVQISCSQDLTLDSIILVQPDPQVRTKLKKFQAGGIERPFDTRKTTPEELVKAALRYKGVPHCTGGNGKTTRRSDGRICIDCSGLLKAAFSDAGLDPDVHGSQEMAHFGQIIADTGSIRKGDLLFYILSYRPADPDIVITHSAIAMGDGRMVHASSRNGVEVIPMNTPYWCSRFIFATRIFR